MTPTDLSNLKNRCNAARRHGADYVDVPVHQLKDLIAIAEQYQLLLKEVDILHRYGNKDNLYLAYEEIGLIRDEPWREPKSLIKEERTHEE